MRTAGIHHITAIASDPLRNLAFYREVLGLRLVKRTVNFDDPGSYHFYFGDHIGRPGSILTFFCWPGARRGMRGSAEVASISFAVAENSFDFWTARLRESNVDVEEIEETFGERKLSFMDPDGLAIEFIIPSEAEGARGAISKPSQRDLSTSLRPGRDDGPVPSKHCIRGLAAPTLAVGDPTGTEKVLKQLLGFRFVAEEGNCRRLEAGNTSATSPVDLVSSESAPGRIAVGSVHHIAFRAVDKSEQLRWREELLAAGFAVSPVMDRSYFHSIYFREPGGILFEIATDGPGFTIDEPAGALGESLKLPPAYEPMRAEIERVLPPLDPAIAA